MKAKAPTNVEDLSFFWKRFCLCRISSPQLDIKRKNPTLDSDPKMKVPSLYGRLSYENQSQRKFSFSFLCQISCPKSVPLKYGNETRVFREKQRMAATSYPHFRKFVYFLIVYSVLIFLNLLYGPLVRATDSGLACPDWPFCFGKVFPDFDFKIFMEVGHRYYSMTLGIILLAGTVWTAIVPELRRPFIGYFLAGILLIVSQAILGGLTVLWSLDAATVNLHLLNAILFLLCIVTATLKAKHLLDSQGGDGFLSAKSLLQTSQIPLLIAVLLVFFQIILGGRVSSNYAGLACLEFPTCNGEWLPSYPEPKIQIQVQHRLGAYLVTFYLLIVNLYGVLKGFSDKTKNYVRIAIVLLLMQIGLGVLNVYAKLPKLVTAAHTGMAVLLFLSTYAIWVQRASELGKEKEV